VRYDFVPIPDRKPLRVMNIGLHPHVIGQPFRVRALRDFIRYAKNHPGVWFPKREEIAEWYLEHHASHITPPAGDQAP